MKKIKVKTVGGVVVPFSKLPEGIAVYCDGKNYYVEEKGESTSDTTYKALKDAIKASQVATAGPAIPDGVN